MIKILVKILALLSLLGLATACSMEDDVQQNTVRPEALTHYSKRPITEDVMYFVLPDRFNNGDTSNDHGGISGGVNDHGFDPSHKGFYHGGDIKGLTAKLDYLADMGISAVWMTPIFKNKAVQPNVVNMTSGYHGYWITDFTQIDPHLGSNDDLKELVKQTHKRNMKVIFDIITNHTADVIKHRECLSEEEEKTALTVPLCAFQNTKDFPTPTLTPYTPEREQGIKVPAWLNDMKYYHNRGDSAWEGESALLGDFAGLDDLNTEHPDVVSGFIDIYKHWISEFKIDGFRIDTVKHVNMEFWTEFSPAILEHAKSEGLEQFYMFGEVYQDGIDPKFLSNYMTVGKLPAVLDFGFPYVAKKVLAENKSPALFKELFDGDHYYETDNGSAQTLPTFLGNHDMGRFGHYLFKENSSLTPQEALTRTKLANALMFLSRGVPVIYYGDEQGFTGDGHDQDAREDMFESVVSSYNDNLLLGSVLTTAANNFDSQHPLYQHIQNLTALRRAHPALQGGLQRVLYASETSGILVIERKDPVSNAAVVVVYNMSAQQAEAPIETYEGFCTLAGDTGEIVTRDNQKIYVAPALSWAAYKINDCK